MMFELSLRAAFVASFVCVATIGAMTARRAARTHRGTLNQLTNEVRGMIAVRAALGLVFYAGAGMWLFASERWPWAYFALPRSARISGVALLALAVLWVCSSFRALGTNYRGGVGLYERHELITNGPYRVVRHPIYIGFIMLMVALWLISGSWLAGGSGLLLVSAIAAARVPIEERQLRERFRSEWESYKQRTGALMPRF